MHVFRRSKRFHCKISYNIQISFHSLFFFFIKILRIDFDMFNHLINMNLNMNLNMNFYIATLFYYITLSSFFKWFSIKNFLQIIQKIIIRHLYKEKFFKMFLTTYFDFLLKLLYDMNHIQEELLSECSDIRYCN